MTFDLTQHIGRQNIHSGSEMIREACRLITGCRDPHYRALAMIELRRMQALMKRMMAAPIAA